MPRPKKDPEAPTNKRSRNGCWACKARRIKCDEDKPKCGSCSRTGEACDYSLRLNWDGRSKRGSDKGVPAAVRESRDSCRLCKEKGVQCDGVKPNCGGCAVGGETCAYEILLDEQATGGGRSADNSRVGGGGGMDHVFSAQHISTASTPRADSPAKRAVRAPSGQHQPAAVAGAKAGLCLERTKSNMAGIAPFALDPALPQTASRASAEPITDSRPLTIPPQPMTLDSGSDGFSWSSQHGAKRRKRSSGASGRPAVFDQRAFAVPPLPPHYDLQTQAPPATSVPTPNSDSSQTPYTVSTDLSPPQPQETPHRPTNLRRLSVKSLLSEEPEHPRHHRSGSSGSHSIYGFDHGLADVDVPRNLDYEAVLPRSPDLRRRDTAGNPDVSSSEDEQDASQMAFGPGGYYAQPVPIRIPKSLEPLHPELMANPMNLLYFHHFTNHTGRINVPHDCPDNPFRTILPQMAMRNTQLLHLLLAFSASHRARLLGHPEPANRIAGWMADVLPTLRQALDSPSPMSSCTDPSDPTSLGPLATAIMLASREIISPNRLTVSISWQDHLQIARRMIIAKGGLHHLAHRSHGARDKTIFFLSRWFAYLDVLGSLSGSKHHRPLSDAYLEDGSGLWLVNRANDEIFKIDCFFGFSGRCIALLAQVAELASECDRHRIDLITSSVRTSWEPSDLIRNRTEQLRARLEASITQRYLGCSPKSPSATTVDDLTAEIYATNTLFHLAGLLHLHRRCLNLPSSAPAIQDLVARTLSLLQDIRSNSTAETCLLFPIFTAGCEALNERDRELFMARLTAVEGWGMEQIARARELMGRVWETGKAWETLVQGEFFG
ncbi:hypothetical protein MBLNU230_g8564t1 [Neophaeotheca triangularis]